MTPTQILFLFLFTVLVIHPTSQYLTYKQGAHLNGNVTLPDIFHQLLPNNRGSMMSDYLAILIGIIYVSLSFLQGNRTDFFDWVKVLAFIYLLKSITMLVTTIPDSQGEYCEYNGFLNLGGCNDLMFSCHTAFIASTLLFLSLLVPQWTYPFLILYMVISGYYIVSARKHYSVDIIIGLYVAVTLFLLRDRF